MKSLHGRYYDWKTIIKDKPIIGRLQITDKWRKNKWGNVLIMCICKCGTIKEKLFGDLNKPTNNRISCGCWQKEIVRSTGNSNKKYYLNRDKLIDNDETAYIMGLLAADGYQGKTKTIGISLQQRDGYIIQRIVDYIEWTGPIRIKKGIVNGKECQKQMRLNICDKDWWRFCQDRGIIRDKTKKYKVPNQYKYNTMFWRGMIDGDGCIFNYIEKSSSKYGISLCGTEDTVLAFRNYCSSVIGEVVTLKIENKPGVKSIMITGAKALKILEELYRSTDNKFYLDRKYEIYKDILSATKGKRGVNHIGKYDTLGMLIEEYSRIGNACKANSIDRGNLILCCMKNRDIDKNYKCKGYVYRYISQYL